MSRESKLTITMNKYHAKRTEAFGITFDSMKEAKRYGELVLLQRAGEITHLRRQETYVLRVDGVLIGKYRCDFAYNENGQVVVEDVKSPITKKLEPYRLKKNLMKAIYGITIKET